MGKIKVFRCRICGDPYMGEQAPLNCPFCGAKQKYFVDAKDWDKDEFNVELNSIEKNNLKAALKLELDNSAFYECAKNAAQKQLDEYGIAKFKSLMKVEREHASAISKFLKISKPELEKSFCSNSINENNKEGWEREDRAIKAYSKFCDEAESDRLKEFFNALVEIEKDHLNLHAENLKNIKLV